ncbi:hypothetical protein [Thermophilibacter sp.]
MILAKDMYDVPDPEPGERPVTVGVAAQRTGYSVNQINSRVRRGILPSRMPRGYQRGRMVFVSQLLYVMEGVSEGAA